MHAINLGHRVFKFVNVEITKCIDWAKPVLINIILKLCYTPNKQGCSKKTYNLIASLFL